MCLFDAGAVEALAAAGHPITPGDVGENLLLAGLPWRECARPGARFALGRHVLLEISEARRTQTHTHAHTWGGVACVRAPCAWRTGPWFAHACVNVSLQLRKRAPPLLPLVSLQVTSPCASTKGGFLKGNNSLMDERSHPGCSRWYARVLSPGWVYVGDAVRWTRAPDNKDA